MAMLIWMFIGELVLILASGLTFLFFWRGLPPQMPWFYSLPWGENQLIPKLWYGLGLLALLLVCVVNYFVARRLYKKDPVVAMVIGGASLLLVVIHLASFFRVLSIMI